MLSVQDYQETHRGTPDVTTPRPQDHASATLLQRYGGHRLCVPRDAIQTRQDEEGVETQDVVQALERQAVNHGVPQALFVDNGSQLIALQGAKFSLGDLDLNTTDHFKNVASLV